MKRGQLLLAVVLIVGILLGTFVYALPIGAALYLAGAARPRFDEDAANKVLERERASHRKQVEAGRAKVKPEDFAPPIARLLRERVGASAEGMAAAFEA